MKDSILSIMIRTRAQAREISRTSSLGLAEREFEFDSINSKGYSKCACRVVQICQ